VLLTLAGASRLMGGQVLCTAAQKTVPLVGRLGQGPPPFKHSRITHTLGGLDPIIYPRVVICNY